MAWPVTPLTTYVPSTTPAIKSFDLNQIQDGVNKLTTGGYTIRNLTVDGVGGAVPSLPGGIRSVAGGSVPVFTAFSPNGTNRSAIDPYGYIGGGACDSKVFDPYSMFTSVTGTATDSILGSTGWLLTQNNPAGNVTSREVGQRYPVIQMLTTTAGVAATLTQNINTYPSRGAALFPSFSDVLAVLDMDVAIATAGAGNAVDFKVGLTNTPLTGGAGPANTWDTSHGVWFEKRSADTFWQAKSFGGTLTSVNTAQQAPVANVPQLLRIVLIASGAMGLAEQIRFYIEGVLVATISGGVGLFPISALSIVLRIDSNVAASRLLAVGPCRFAVNRRAAPVAGI